MAMSFQPFMESLYHTAVAYPIRVPSKSLKWFPANIILMWLRPLGGIMSGAICSQGETSRTLMRYSMCSVE